NVQTTQKNVDQTRAAADAKQAQIRQARFSNVACFLGRILGELVRHPRVVVMRFFVNERRIVDYPACFSRLLCLPSPML
ncbi:MAG: hypothetical protein ABI835_08365, partial [Chloroflexota bacterium]